jgi:hypothetical protein
MAGILVSMLCGSSFKTERRLVFDLMTDTNDTGLPPPIHPDIEEISIPFYDPDIVLDLVGWIALGVDRGYCSPASTIDTEKHPEAPPSALIIDLEQS